MTNDFIKEFENLFSIKNLYEAHKKAKKGKNIKIVGKFEDNLFENLSFLRDLILSSGFEFGPYKYFEVFDSKKRLIVSSPYKDRVIHWVLYDYMYPIFVKSFISDSFGNIKGRGTLFGLNRAKKFFRKKENNYILKLDFSKYFFSVYHHILIQEIDKKIKNPFILDLLKKLIYSFKSPGVYDDLFKIGDKYLETQDKGMPIGNLTSQLFANIYLNRLDHFSKDYLKIKFYLRYVDDVVIFCKTKQDCNLLIKKIISFSKNKLKLTLNPRKINISPKIKGLDFLGYRISNYSILPRKITQRKIRKSIFCNDLFRLRSYYGVLKYGDSYLKEVVKGLIEQ